MLHPFQPGLRQGGQPAEVSWRKLHLTGLARDISDVTKLVSTGFPSCAYGGSRWTVSHAEGATPAVGYCLDRP